MIKDAIQRYFWVVPSKDELKKNFWRNLLFGLKLVETCQIGPLCLEKKNGTIPNAIQMYLWVVPPKEEFQTSFGPIFDPDWNRPKHVKLELYKL